MKKKDRRSKNIKKMKTQFLQNTQKQQLKERHGLLEQYVKLSDGIYE
jgi:hypothetical protein